jgi:aspartyl protease family protein
MSFAKRHSNLLGLIILSAASLAQATDVSVVGLFGSKAMLMIDGSKRIMAPGEATPDGVKLISVESDGAVLEIEGKRRTLKVGQGASLQSTGGNGNPTTVLVADARGHFMTTGVINGVSARMMVDTGATMVSMSSAEARRIGLSYLNGERGMVSTANGVVPAYRVVLNTVKVGNITLNQVDGLVQESSMPFVLLGMSFLRRVEMKRDGSEMTLIKKY